MSTWVLTANGPGEGKQLPPSRSLGASIQAVGAFGGGTVTIEVSNDGTNYFPLSLLDGTAAPTLSADGLIEISTGAKYIRPVLAGSSGGTINILLGSGA